jgi:hypothetical protein
VPRRMPRSRGRLASRRSSAAHRNAARSRAKQPAPAPSTSARRIRMIRKLASGDYRLYSRKKDARTGKRRNLGTPQGDARPWRSPVEAGPKRRPGTGCSGSGPARRRQPHLAGLGRPVRIPSSHDIPTSIPKSAIRLHPRRSVSTIGDRRAARFWSSATMLRGAQAGQVSQRRRSRQASPRRRHARP